jgi:hypothetical protein
MHHHSADHLPERVRALAVFVAHSPLSGDRSANLLEEVSLDVGEISQVRECQAVFRLLRHDARRAVMMRPTGG